VQGNFLHVNQLGKNPIPLGQIAYTLQAFCHKIDIIFNNFLLTKPPTIRTMLKLTYCKEEFQKFSQVTSQTSLKRQVKGPERENEKVKGRTEMENGK